MKTCNKGPLPSVRKVKRQFCCSMSHVETLRCAAPQTVCSSHTLKMQEQLHRLDPKSVNVTPGLATTSVYPSIAWCHTSNMGILHVNQPKLGQQTQQTPKATVTQEKQKSFSACLSRGAITVLPPPTPHYSTWLLAWYHSTPRQRPDLTPHQPFLLSTIFPTNTQSSLSSFFGKSSNLKSSYILLILRSGTKNSVKHQNNKLQWIREASFYKNWVFHTKQVFFLP